MTKSLLLTPDQVLKVAELNLEVANKNEAIRNDVNITPERKKEFTRGNLDGRKSQLKLILTPEQFKKLEENEAKRKANISAKKAKKQKTINPSIEVMEEL
jgi:Spy/CpxP family protein refolding chaperone